jgi:DNA-directed RNA polymerase subunit E"
MVKSTKPKACRLCNTIYEGAECPKCASKESTESFKGRIIVLDPTKSELAQKLNLKDKGNFAIKTR